LGLEVSCVTARAEEESHNAKMRDKFDIAVSRAVAGMSVLCELCLPFVRVGGLFIAMKSVDSTEEVFAAQNAIKMLGGEMQEHFDYTIPGTEIIHRAIIIKKTSKTPDKYPRRFAKIQKSPL